MLHPALRPPLSPLAVLMVPDPTSPAHPLKQTISNAIYHPPAASRLHRAPIPDSLPPGKARHLPSRPRLHMPLESCLVPPRQFRHPSPRGFRWSARCGRGYGRWNRSCILECPVSERKVPSLLIMVALALENRFGLRRTHREGSVHLAGLAPLPPSVKYQPRPVRGS